MSILRFGLEKQLLTVLNQEIIASGDANVDQCTFSFDAEWDDYTKTAVFYQDKAHVRYVILEADNTCMIPAAAMTREGKLYVGVFGISGAKVLSSTVADIYIHEGAVSDGEIDTEPSDDVFLAIIAQYQRIAELMHSYDEKAMKLLNDTEALNARIEQSITEQNEILQSLGAFDVTELEYRMSAMELKLSGYGEQIETEIATMNDLLDKIENSAFLIRDVEVTFDEELQCIVEDERITEESVVNAYFDAISVESTLNHAIYVESFDGYVKFSTTTKFEDTLICTLEIRRY